MSRSFTHVSPFVMGAQKALTSKLLAVPVLALTAYIGFSFVSAVTGEFFACRFFLEFAVGSPVQ